MVSASVVARRFKEAYPGRFTIPRPMYLPEAVRNRKPIVPEGTDLAIWTWEENGNFYGIAFQGKANKPLWNYRFRNEASRDRQIKETVESRLMTLKYKEDRQKERREYQHPYKVGDILYTSWGYDETHVDFYEVTDVRGKVILVRRTGKKVVKEERGANYVVAVPGKYQGPPIRVVPTPSSVKIERHFASLWDGKPKYETGFGFGH